MADSDDEKHEVIERKQRTRDLSLIKNKIRRNELYHKEKQLKSKEKKKERAKRKRERQEAGDGDDDEVSKNSFIELIKPIF